MRKSSDLRSLDVVNVLDGRKLGPITDLELDLAAGRVTAIVVPAPGRFWWFLGGEKEYVIPWEKVVKVGVDVILVEFQPVAGQRGRRQVGAAEVVPGPGSRERLG